MTKIIFYCTDIRKICILNISNMQQVISTHKIHLTNNSSYAGDTPVIISLISEFIAWCNMQEKNWFLWLAVALVAGIGAVLPLTMFAIVFGGDNNFALWVIVSVTNVPILVVNLAQQPAKVKLPVLFFAWITNAIIITYCLVHFFMK